MGLNLKDILGGLEKGLDFAETMLPVVKMIPGVGNVASLVELAAKVADGVGAVREVAVNVQARVADGVIMATEKDQAKLKAIIAKLDAENDALNDYIVNS